VPHINLNHGGISVYGCSQKC